MQKKIILIALAVFSITIIIAHGNIEKVSAIVLLSNEPIETASVFGGGYSFYVPTKDYLVFGVTTGTPQVSFVRGSDLSFVSTVSLTGGNVALGRGSVVKCDSSFCYIMTAGAGGITGIEKINLNTFAVTSYYNTTWTNCIPNAFEVLSSSIIFTMEDLGGCPFTGVYFANKDFTATGNWFTPVSNQPAFGAFTGTAGSCLVGNNYMKAIGDLLYKYNTATKSVTSVDTGTSAISAINCDSTFAYISSNAGNYVKRIAISSLTVMPDIATITAPTNLMARGDSVYVSRSTVGANTVSAFQKTNLTNGFVFLTLNSNENIYFQGNATRFNILSPQSNNNIFYSVDGVFAPELEGQGEIPAGGNQVNGICDVGTALDCVGDRSTINQITGGSDIKEVANSLFVGIGVVNGTNTDIQTNGTGLLLWLITGTFFAIALVGTIGKMNQAGYINVSTRDIDPIYWLFLVVAVTSIAFYLQWIPDIVFYGMIVGIAGLFSFGIYRHFRSG